MTKEVQFYIVPTPIGNLKDITLRAIEVLKSVDIIACEDTRTTQKLLNHYEIKTKTIAYHKFNEKESADGILKLLNEGKKVALVSDAGTPVISDPGAILVEKLRQNNIKITSLAGANAITTFLSQIGVDDFSYVGFLPKTENQITELLQKYSFTNMVFYESPNRLIKTLEIIKNFDNNAKVAVGRELTKVFEEIIIDKVSNTINYFENNILKGEIVAMVYKKENIDFGESEILEKINILKKKNFKTKEISTILSELYGLNKNEVYQLVTRE